MKTVETIKAVGHILCHDLTQIIPNEFKGVKFKKGHIVKEEDIPILLSMGKENLYIWEKSNDIYHENEACESIRDLIIGRNISFSEAKEGKISFYAETDGLLKIDVEKLMELNCLGEITCATMLTNTYVKKGENIGAIKIIPLIIDSKKIENVKEIIKKSIINIVEVSKKKVGIITTGSEIYKGRIKDAFGPVLKLKMEKFGSEILGQVFCDDNSEMIKEQIDIFLRSGAEIILCTGGMSVDPDDVTPTAINLAADELVTYGSPVLPGAMFLLAYKNIDNSKIPILGLPGCVMYAKTTIFDILIPRILSGEILNLKDIARLGHGGLCASCNECHYPNCSFGKG